MKLTKRGKRVRAVAIVILVVGIYYVATSFWWVGVGAPTEDFLGYCFGDMVECFYP